MIPVQIIVADLKSKYKEIESETNNLQFFLKAAHYGKFILENEIIVSVLEPLYIESKTDFKSCDEAWKEFKELWKIYAEDILKQARKAGINDNGPLSNDIASIQGRLKELDKDPLMESEISGYFIPYWNLVRRFNDLGKSSFLVPKHLESKDGQMIIYPAYEEVRNEWEKFKLSREIKVWWAHYQICRLAVGVLNLDNLAKYFKNDDVVSGFYDYEFNELAKGNLDRTPIVLHESKYRIWIKRLQEYLLPRLQVISETKITEKKMDFLDTATMRGFEKKWEVLQAIWVVYESSSRADSIMLAIKRLRYRGRVIEEVDGIIEGLKNEKLFKVWVRKDRHYSIEDINHDNLEEYYEDLRKLSKQFINENNESNKQKDSVKLKGKKIIFLEKEPSIQVGNKSCNLPPYKNEHYLCKVMFEHRIGEAIDWSIVYEKMTGDEGFEKKWRTVYDTMRRVNERLMKQLKTKDELFSWQSATIKRNF